MLSSKNDELACVLLFCSDETSKIEKFMWKMDKYLHIKEYIKCYKVFVNKFYELREIIH